MKDLQSVIQLIKSSVLLGDILVQKGVIRGSLPEEQFACLFHGVDRKKSCRYYKDTDTAYCWVCKEKWDIISFTQRAEGSSFAQAINHLIKLHRIDVSKLPDTVEAEKAKIINRQAVKLDQRQFAMENLMSAINAARTLVLPETYDRFVYTYMMLKYVTPDETFKEMYVKLREAMERVINKK